MNDFDWDAAEREMRDAHMDPERCGRLRCRRIWPCCGHSYLSPEERLREPEEDAA